MNPDVTEELWLERLEMSREIGRLIESLLAARKEEPSSTAA